MFTFMKYRKLLFFALLFNTIYTFGQVTIVSDGLNGSTSLFTLSGGAYYTGNSAGTDRVANSSFTSEGTNSRGIINGTATLTSNSINTAAYSGISMSFRLAAFSIGAANNGMDAGDIVTVEVSPDGGTNYYSTVRVLGFSNCYWSYSGGTGFATTAYDGDAAPIDFQPTNGGSTTAEGYSTVTVTGLPAVTNLKFRITLLNNDVKELWVVDDFKVQGTVAIVTSNQNGDWYVGSTWIGGIVPTSSQSVIINHAVYSTAAITEDLGKTITVNTGATLSVGATLTNNGAVNINGTFQINAGGFANGTSPFTYAASGSTLIMNHNNGSPYIISSGQTFWPTGAPPNNVTINANSPTRLDMIVGSVSGLLTITNTSPSLVNATLDCNILNALTVTATGTALVNDQLRVSVSGGFNSVGILQLNSGGYINTNPPQYYNTSTLVYNTTGTYGVGNEWTGGSAPPTVGIGTPQNVTIQNSTTLTMPAASRSMAGNLNITSGNLTLNTTLYADLYIAGNWTRVSTAFFTHNNRTVYFYSGITQTITVSGGGTETFYALTLKGTGNLKIATGTNIVVTGSAGLGLSSSNATTTLDLNGQSLTLSGGGSLAGTSGANKITSTVANGTFIISNSTLFISFAGTGTLTTDTNTILKLKTSFNLNNYSLTINGTLQIDTGGNFITNSPKYGNASNLIYNSGGTFGRGYEWTALGVGTIGTTAGYPNNVQLSGNTTLNYNNGTPLAKAINGNLTIDAGSSFYMDYGGSTSGGFLTIAGNVTNNGNFTLGFANGDDLKIAGDFVNTGNFNGNGRALYFTKNGTQTVSSTTVLTFPYVVFQPLLGSTTVQLLSSLTVSAPSTGNAISFSSAFDVFDINGNTLTIGTTGIANVIFGTGSFKGSTTSNLTLLGTGSIGTLNFASNLNLGTFTMNRTAAAVGCVMSSSLTVNSSLVLTNGLIDLGANTMTLAATCSNIFTASANSYVIAESTVAGVLSKVVTATGTGYVFPIGSGVSQYSPATVNFTAGTFASATLGMAVKNSVEPNWSPTPANYLNRYWSLTTSGITTPTYDFSATYPVADVIGSISAYYKSNQWDGSDWTNNGTAITSGSISKTGCTTNTVVNHISAAQRDQEIEVKSGVAGITILNGTTTTNGNAAFGTKTIGSTTANTFSIYNRGGAGLNLTATPRVEIITSASSGDFVVTTQPSVATVAAESSATFVITFTPSYVGYRTATVRIYSNDNDENPYTFVVDGTGDCGVPTNTITPTSGPVGTEVTITATVNNLYSATASINGVSTTISNYSPAMATATVIKAIIPATAVSGALITTNNLGCQASNTFTVLDNTSTSCEGGLTATDLFMSEVTDSNFGSLTYIEIYNGTGSSKNLGTYLIKVANNGGAYTLAMTLNSVVLPSGSTYVVAMGNDSACGTAGGNGSLAAQSVAASSINFSVNGHDHYGLFNGATLIDSWGVFGSNNWAPASVGTEGATFRRKNTATIPSTTYSNSDWNIIDYLGSSSSAYCTNNDYSDIGLYNFRAGVPPTVTTLSYTPTCKGTTLTVTGTEGFTGSNPLVYTWYAVQNGSNTWNLISNGGIYSGATTNSLVISDIATVLNYQFYCQVRENTATCYVASNAIKITVSQSTTWQSAPVNTWSNAVPTLNTAVIIDNDYDTANGFSPSFNACSLTINNGKTVTIRAATYANIQNDLTVNAGGSLTVENNGSLVMVDDNGVVTNNGTTQIKRTAMGIKGYDYVYWSSPVIGQSIDAIYSSPTPGLKYKWNPLATNINSPTSSGTWQLTSGTMTPATGYIVRGSTSYGMTATNIPSVFSGAVNSGIVPSSITRGSYQGVNYSGANGVTVTKFDDNWNLIGNPYPSSIKALDFLTLNTNIQGFVYLWTHNTAPVSTTNPFYNSFAYNYTANDYITYNGTATTSGPTGFNGYIAAGQGFFVLMNDGATGTQTVNFKNSMRNKTYDNSQFYRTAQTTDEKHRIWLDLVDSNNQPVRTVVGYVPEATIGLDRLYDAYKNVANDKNIYSLAENETLIIQGRPLPFDVNDEVPIGIRIMQDGAYKIAIGAVDGLFTDGQAIYLEDKYLNIIFDLRENPYSFSSVAGIFNDRFVLRYTNNTLGNQHFETLDNSVVVATNHGELIIKSYIENIQEVTVYDILGRQLFFAQAIENTSFMTSNISLSQQTLIVKIKLTNGVLITRKIIL